MKVILDIDMSNAKAIDLLNYIRTLDFISIKGEKIVLNDAQRKAIEVGLMDVAEKKTFSTDEVMKESRKKYPELFGND